MVRQRIVAIIGMLGSCSIAPAYGQIVPDGTTVDTSVSGNCQNYCSITGGTIAEQNLFHSFQEFNIRAGESVYFNDQGLANIFSRITGTNVSEILGTLGVSGGNANLFLINPNGIVFGEGATLDLNGSFFATTASEIQFGDRAFSTIPKVENLPLLTVNPSALFFNQIGQNGSIVLDGANLTVPPQQDLTLLGRESNTPGILLKNSTIDVSEGNIFLGAVKGNATVEIKDNLPLQFSEAVSRGDITLTQGSRIVASNSDNAGDQEINLDAKNLEINENSSVLSFTSGSGNGANININASESVKITGIAEDTNALQQFVAENLIPGGNADFNSSGLQTNTLGTGYAGNIQVVTRNLAIDNAGVISVTRDRGKSGNINVNVSDLITLKGSGLLTSSDTLSTGDIGQIEIDTEQLLLEPGGIISASTLGGGDAGNLTIKASDSIQIKDTPVNSIIPTGILASAIVGNGNSGDINIETQKLSLRNGGLLAASSGAATGNGIVTAQGQSGNININAAEFVEVGGVSEDQLITSGIISDTRNSNPAGNIMINTGSLFLNPYGVISASSLDTGIGGNITINATNLIRLEGIGNDSLQQLYSNLLQGQIQLEDIPPGLTAFTILAGDTGNISLVTPRLSLESRAILTTGTLGVGNAGNIEIAAGESVDVTGSLIAAPTIGTGDAGNIHLHTRNLNVTDGGAIISITSTSGNAGDIDILATESIEFSNTASDVLFAGSISTASYADLSFAGNLTIATKHLSIKDGTSIQSNNFLINSIADTATTTKKNTTESRLAKLTINASESIEISGSSPLSNPFSPTSNSQISATTNTANPASDVEITTGKLSIFDGGAISINSLGTGAAGSLEIIADSISLDNNASLNGTTRSGRGGNIVLQVNNILNLNDDSQIDTDSLTFGDGGNIDITANFVVASENSSISANALTSGNGGNVNINAIDLFVTNDSKITADSQQGIEGTVKVKTSFDSDRYNNAKLSQKIAPAENIVVQHCGGNNAQGAFTYTGRGGLPANPLEFQTDNTIIADLDLSENATVDDFEVKSAIIAPTPQNIVEAQEWKINQKGNIELVASASNSSNTLTFDTFSCPL